LQRLSRDHRFADRRIGTDRVAKEIFVKTLGVIEDYEYVWLDTAGNERRSERIAAWAGAGDISGQKSEWKKRKKNKNQRGSPHELLLEFDSGIIAAISE
jgi:hypothetical protein